MDSVVPNDRVRMRMINSKVDFNSEPRLQHDFDYIQNYYCN